MTNVVTGVNHQRTTTLAYDKNGNLTTATVADANGGDASRKTSYGYNNNDRQTSVTDPLNHTSITTYDAVGNVVQAKDALGRVTSTSYTSRYQPSTVKLLGFIDDPINPGTPRDATPTRLGSDRVACTTPLATSCSRHALMTRPATMTSVVARRR